ncbi:MAG TPA: hypothetical protein VFD27_03795 [Chthoniobacteraceae bacterium]|jgi:hypothetical protein|nr:hypothetical protein [Chthoniobacteraceae bacterium]
MDDELKSAWQSQIAPQRLTLDAGLVLNEVRRNERQFAATIWCRDVCEVGVALLLVPVWIYLGIKQSLPWSWYLVVPTLLWIAGFMIVDRMRQRPRQPGPGDTLRSSIESSLAQVEHQIWLLRNVFWWYLLPPFTAMTIWPAHRAWQTRDDGLKSLAEFAGIALTFALVAWFIYWLNQFAVRKNLEPRRKELKTLLANLNESREA